jgi:hypothetical protein
MSCAIFNLAACVLMFEVLFIQVWEIENTILHFRKKKDHVDIHRYELRAICSCTLFTGNCSQLS